jgi:hypothetical protein
MRVALFVLVAVAVLSVAELASEGFRDFTGDHPLIATFVTEAVLLVGVYLVIDEIIQRRETRRWSDVTTLGIRALSTRAHEPSRIVRHAVGELAAETERQGPDFSAADDEAVSDWAGELGDWLRGDDQRAGAFARGMRHGASGLEEAIIRWGPTLVESPDSAELINLLPDIIDAARSAASAVAPGEAPPWADDERQAFADNVLVVLGNADEFAERLSPRVG